MVVTVSSDLGQVGDGDDLDGTGNVGHHLANHVGHVTAHAGVHLIKDDAGQLHVTGDDCLYAQHYT